MKNTLIILILVIFAGSSCKHSSKNDLSLTVKEYQMKGMPDIDTVWSEQNYIKAHITLGNIRLSNFFSLPRKNSKKSGLVFSRIISKENLSFLDDPAKSLSDKAFQIQSLSNFLNELSRMYTDNLRSGQYYYKELTDIYSFELFVRKKMLELADKIMNSRKDEDIRMQSGRTAIINGYTSLISSLLREQAKSKAFPPGEMKRLSTEVSRSLAENLQYIDSAGRVEISGQIQKTIEKSSSFFVKNNYRKVLKKLNANNL